jgi:hypothetical protein
LCKRFGGSQPFGVREFEQLLLLAILRLDTEAYDVDITRELEARAGRFGVARRSLAISSRSGTRVSLG